MHLVRDANSVLLDSSTFYRFCDAQLIAVLKGFLGAKARITREVSRELFVAPLDGVHRDLSQLQDPPWPKKTGHVPGPLRADADRLITEARLEEARARGVPISAIPACRHAGEVTTVLMGQHLHADLVVVDDRFGKKLARARKVPRISTAELSLQMVADGVLNDDEGFSVFDCSTPRRAGRPRYNQALQSARAQMK